MRFRRVAEGLGRLRCPIMAAVCCAAAILVSAAHGMPAVGPAGDVILRPDGSVVGRVVRGGGLSPREPTAALRVRLARDGQVVSETLTDRRGGFSLRNLRGGLYQIVVDTPQGERWRSFRVWQASAAPPGGAREMTIELGGEVARGQSPIPPTRLRTAAALTAIAAGAIAAPVIYNKTKAEPLIPASP